MTDPMTRRLPLRGSAGLGSSLSDEPTRDNNSDDGWLGGPRASTTPFESRLSTDATTPLSGSGAGAGFTPGGAVNPFGPGSTPPLLPDETTTKRARTSIPCTLGLLFAFGAALVTLTGVLAPLALTLAAVAFVFSVLGLFTGRRRHVSGRVLAVLAILLAIAAAGFTEAQHLHRTDLFTTGHTAEHLNHWLRAKIPFLH